MRFGPLVLLQALASIVAVTGYFTALWFTMRLRRALAVRAHDFWLDSAALPRVEWSSRALLGDRRAELLGPSGSSRYFPNDRVARHWLAEHDFVEADRALKEALVIRRPV